MLYGKCPHCGKKKTWTSHKGVDPDGKYTHWCDACNKGFIIESENCSDCFKPLRLEKKVTTVTTVEIPGEVPIKSISVIKHMECKRCELGFKVNE